MLPTKDEIQHDLLLVITTVLAVLFATGISKPGAVPGDPVIFP